MSRPGLSWKRRICVGRMELVEMITPYQVMYYGFSLDIIRSRLGEETFKIFKKEYDHMLDATGGDDCLELNQQFYGKSGVTIH